MVKLNMTFLHQAIDKKTKISSNETMYVRDRNTLFINSISFLNFVFVYIILHYIANRRFDVLCFNKDS